MWIARTCLSTALWDAGPRGRCAEAGGGEAPSARHGITPGSGGGPPTCATGRIRAPSRSTKQAVAITRAAAGVLVVEGDR
jgi:hypothetical protein